MCAIHLNAISLLLIFGLRILVVNTKILIMAKYFLLYMREMLNKYIFFITSLLVSFEFYAQGGGAPPPTPVPSPPGLPVDKGVLFLLGSGLLFGLYKIYSSILKKKHSI